jgi:beta-lactamase regulating signal transducer with metallopeptidase domain
MIMDFVTTASPAFLLILDTALKGAILIAAAAAAAYLLRKHSAAARHAVWTAAVLGHLALPLLTLVAPEWRLPIVRTPGWMIAPQPAAVVSQGGGSEPAAATAATPAPPSTARASDPRSGQPSPNPADIAPSAESPASLLSYLALAWMVGAALVLLRLVVGTWRVSRLAREGARVEDGEWLSLSQRVATRLGIARPLTLLRGDRLGIPVTWGVVYPAVLLPPESAQWPEARRRFVLVHEMAHVKRFDALTQLCSQIALAVFWFDPLLWLAVRRMQVEREHACDDYVLRDGTAPSLYAGELLDMVRSLGTPRHEHAAPAFAALAMARRAEFEGRMLAILDPAIERGPLHRIGMFMTAAIVALLALPLAAIHPFDSPTPSSIVSSSRPALDAPTQPVSTASVQTVREGIPAAAAAAPTCDGADLGTRPGSSSHSIHSDDNPSVLTYRSVTSGRCVEATIVGTVQFADDEQSVVRLPAGARAFFRERLIGSDRSVEIRSGPDGRPLYDARANGREVSFDAAMQRWLAGIMPEILREGSINVAARVARLRARGGTPAVLDEIARIRNGGAKRAHYKELIQTPSLAPREAGAVVRHAGQEVSSSGDLRNILQSVPRQLRSGAAVREALAGAVRKISSSGDKAAVLGWYGETDDPAMLSLVLTEAKGVSSSGDKARLLARLAPRAVGHPESAVGDAFFETAETIQSSGDLARTLSVAMNSGRDTEDVSLAVIRATGRISSSGDKSRVLVELARKGRVNTAKVREAYLAAARKVSSDGDYRRVMDAISRVEGSL